jgi:hypothetical protein
MCHYVLRLGRTPNNLLSSARSFAQELILKSRGARHRIISDISVILHGTSVWHGTSAHSPPPFASLDLRPMHWLGISCRCSCRNRVGLVAWVRRLVTVKWGKTHFRYKTFLNLGQWLGDGDGM